MAAGAGVAALTTQIGLQTWFARSSDPVFSKSAGVTAHSVIATLFCIFVTAFGCIGWWGTAPPLTAVARVLDPVASVRWLGAFGFGVIGLWDIATCFAVAELRKPSFLIHHFAMAAVAFCGLLLPSWYAFFFLGVVELSSIPLCIYEGLARAYDIASSEDECAPDRCEQLMKVRDGLQGIATLLFVVVRLYLFTKVTFFDFWPDARSVLPSMGAGAAKSTVRFLMVSSASFVALQFFWFGQIIQQIVLAKWLAPTSTDTAEPA